MGCHDGHQPPRCPADRARLRDSRWRHLGVTLMLQKRLPEAIAEYEEICNTTPPSVRGPRRNAGEVRRTHRINNNFTSLGKSARVRRSKKPEECPPVIFQTWNSAGTDQARRRRKAVNAPKPPRVNKAIVVGSGAGAGNGLFAVRTMLSNSSWPLAPAIKPMSPSKAI